MSGSFSFPWDMPVPVASPDPPDPPPPRKRRGRRRAPRISETGAFGWLYHHLTISGPAETVQVFAAAARGAGVTPWQLDVSQVEEDIFLRAVSQPVHRRTLTVAGCRILARQFRDRVEAHHARATALVGHSQACPFDLHALLPVPDAILQLGPTDPAALSWLGTHWGVTDQIRQVRERAKATMGHRLAKRHAVIGYGFFTAGATPDAAIAQLAARWPAVRFVLQPRPTD